MTESAPDSQAMPQLETSRINAATERHNAGYNCAQAVACAYAEALGVDEQLIFRATEGLGLGMGGMEGTCGALSGACLIAGLLNSDGNLDKPASKRSTYQISRKIVERFGELSGSTVCRKLKGAGTGKVLCSCPQCVINGATALEEVCFPELGQ